MLAGFLTPFDLSAVNIALPTITSEFSMDTPADWGTIRKIKNLHQAMLLKGKGIFLENVLILIFFSRFID